MENEDVKDQNIWLAEEGRLSIATLVKNEDCIFKTVEDWRLLSGCVVVRQILVFWLHKILIPVAFKPLHCSTIKVA